MGYTGSLSPLFLFLSKAEFGEQTVKIVHNLLGSVSLTSSFLFCLFGTESIMELKAVWNLRVAGKISISTKQMVKLYLTSSGPFSGYLANNVILGYFLQAMSSSSKV